MNRILGIVIFMVVPLYFSGCATYWYQEGKSFEECKQDRQTCFEEMKNYSPEWEKLGKYEFELMENCMIQKGYRLVRERQLYLTVKREDPDLEVPWIIHGVSGFIEQEE